MDPETAQFATTFTCFLEAMSRSAEHEASELTEVGQAVQDFLGVPLAEVDPVLETFPPHQVVDLDLALSTVRTELGARMFGVNGPHRLHVDAFLEFLQRTHWNFRIGAVSYVRMPTGPDSERRVVSFGICLVRVDGEPVVWLQRAATPQYGREQYAVELMAAEPSTVERLLRRVRTLMAEQTVLRGQVITFQRNDFDYHAPGAAFRFLSRPEVAAEEVILPEGQLDKIIGHVIGIGEHRHALLAAGQHLKRGVLLYGPPGTGKTHIVRHLLSRTPGTTAVLLSGRTLGLLGDAARLARATQPAIVVLEDCDLIAEERGGETNAALFETLEALDGLDGDADVTFVLTTNRPDLLERALAERPGRVDLAVSIDKPDLGGRRRLLRLYAAELVASGSLTEDALDTAAARTEGVTASFAKELVRRVVVRAARDGREPTDADLANATQDMQSDAEQFTRVLLGGADAANLPPARLAAEPGLVGGATWHMSFGDT